MRNKVGIKEGKVNTIMMIFAHREKGIDYRKKLKYLRVVTHKIPKIRRKNHRIPFSGISPSFTLKPWTRRTCPGGACWKLAGKNMELLTKQINVDNRNKFSATRQLIYPFSLKAPSSTLTASAAMINQRGYYISDYMVLSRSSCQQDSPWGHPQQDAIFFTLRGVRIFPTKTAIETELWLPISQKLFVFPAWNLV